MHQHNTETPSNTFCPDCTVEALEYFKRLLGIIIYNNGGEVTLDTSFNLEGYYLDYIELDETHIKVQLKIHESIN